MPTPVSALIHAATLVTAGVYLLLRSSPLLEYAPTALLAITWVGAITAFFAATTGLFQNDLKRIIAYSTCSQMGWTFILVIYIIFFLDYKINLDSGYAFKFLIVPLLSIKKDRLDINEYIDNYNDFSYGGKLIIKNKYAEIPCIYLWKNNLNGKCYVGRSINLYRRVTEYLSVTYINKNSTSMAIVAAIKKYGIENFTLVILEKFNKKISIKNLAEKENYWYQVIGPSYNIQDILQPFTGANHYRFGQKVSEEMKLKISNTLKGRLLSEGEKVNHILGALPIRDKPVYCYDWETGHFLMEFSGIRIMARALNFKNINSILRKLDNNKPFVVTINEQQYRMLLKSTKKNTQ